MADLGIAAVSRRRKLAPIVSLDDYRQALAKAEELVDHDVHQARRVAADIMKRMPGSDEPYLLDALAIAIGAALSVEPERKTRVLDVIEATLDELRAKA